MSHRLLRPFLALVAVLVAAGCGGSSAGNGIEAASAGARTFQTLELDGATVELAVAVPEGLAPGESAPVLLALPPGAQGRSEVEAGLDLYWETGARERGWVVVSPVAPDGVLFFRGSEAVIPGLLDAVAATYPPEGGRFAVSGVSNGGLSAFRVALDSPDRFFVLLTIPGFPPQESDFARLDRLVSGTTTALYVGENDSGWREQAEAAAAELERLGAVVSLTVSAGEGHILRNVGADELFDVLDATLRVDG